MRQRTLVELGRLTPQTAREIGRLCHEVRGYESPHIHRHGVGAPLLLDALLTATGADQVLREIGRRKRGPSLEPALRLLVAGRLFGMTSTAATARNQRRLSAPDHATSPVSYDLLLRALGTLGDEREALETWLAGQTGDTQAMRIAIGSGFCAAGSPPSPPLHVSVSTRDLLPLSIRQHPPARANPDIVACCDCQREGHHLRSLRDHAPCSLIDLGHTRTILGRALLERAADCDVCALGCGGEARPVAGPDGRRYALVRPGGIAEDPDDEILARVTAAESRLAQLQRDVRAGKVCREATIANRARRVIGDAQAWRWVEFETAEGRVIAKRRAAQLRRDLAHAGEHVVRIDGNCANALRALDAASTLAALINRDVHALPVHHRATRRIDGHFAVCLLAAWLMRPLALRLRDRGSELAGRDATRVAGDAEALRFDLPGGPLFGRPPVGADLSETLKAAGVERPRAAVKDIMSRLHAGA